MDLNQLAFKNNGNPIVTFDVHNSESFIIFYYSNFNLKRYTINPVTHSMNTPVTSSAAVAQVAANFFEDGTTAYLYYSDHLGSGQDAVERHDISLTTSTIHPLGILAEDMVVTPDYSKALLWTSTTQVSIFRMSDFALLHIYNGSIVGTTGLTQTITFSQDSKWAIIEADSSASLVVFDLETYTVLHTVSVAETILYA